MPNIRAFLFTILVYITFTAALTDAASFGIRLLRKDLAGAEDVDTNVNQDKDPTTFSHLLSAVSPQALDRLLHQYAPGTFKNGVSSPDRKSVEVVPARTPEPPSRVVRMAIRQATSGNDTSTSDTTTSTTSSTSDTLSTTSTTSTKQTPMETTSTSQDTPTSPSSTPESTPTPTSTSASTPTMASTTEVTETTEPVETTSTTETSEPTSSSPPQTSESSSGTDSSTSK
ncbi:hypothetical protein RRF57_002940 [Xylaria bambusicola]|uniref:Uncharacterized protein n=1 Tax=Xylaria bambusicola TaxID=326684 RepID=A0AAN7U720_9PEZI